MHRVGVGPHPLFRHLTPDEVKQVALLIAQELPFPGGLTRRLGRGSAADVGQLAQRPVIETEGPGVALPREEDRAAIRRHGGSGSGLGVWVGPRLATVSSGRQAAPFHTTTYCPKIWNHAPP